jgi:TrmH family RNA methyltransferase
MLSKSEIKYIQSLAHKKFRDQEGCFVVEGEKMVDELLTAFPVQVVRMYATRKWIAEQNRSLPPELTVFEVEDFEMAKISFLSSSSPVLALVRTKIRTVADIDLKASMVLLDHIQDPGNLGTIIRSCDWFGIRQLVCSPHTVDAFNPKVVQSAMGSLLRLNIIYTDLRELMEKGLIMPVYAAVLQGRSVFEVHAKKPFALMVGNESRGVSPALQALASETVMIPRIGDAESLNAAVATSVLLSALTK